MTSTTRSLALAAAVATVGIVVIPAAAQDPNPTVQRHKLMEQNGRDAKAGGQMLKGDIAYDPAKAKMIFTSMHAVASKFGGLFPPDSKTGNKTQAAPEIWTKPAEFKAAVAKFEADTQKAMIADLSTIDGFKAQFGTVTQNCRSCHEIFRVKES